MKLCIADRSVNYYTIQPRYYILRCKSMRWLPLEEETAGGMRDCLKDANRDDGGKQGYQ